MGGTIHHQSVQPSGNLRLWTPQERNDPRQNLCWDLGSGFIRAPPNSGRPHPGEGQNPCPAKRRGTRASARPKRLVKSRQVTRPGTRVGCHLKSKSHFPKKGQRASKGPTARCTEMWSRFSSKTPIPCVSQVPQVRALQYTVPFEVSWTDL